MSKQEVEDSKQIVVPAQKPEYNRGKTTFLDGIKVNEVPALQKPAELFYDSRGNLTENSVKSMAKKIFYKSGAQDCFVKFATAGVNTGKMLNPWGPSYNTGDEFKYEKTMGRFRYEFRKVSSLVFDLYIRFLETKNERHLLNAERENNG